MRLTEAFASSESIVAVMRASDGVFLDVNPAFERSTGWRREQVIGRIPVEIGLWQDPGFRSKIWSVLRGDHRAVAVPTRIVCADGSVRTGLLSAEFASEAGQPVVFCLLYLLPEGEDAAGEETDHRFYRSLYLAASEGLYRSLPGGGFLDVNPAMARIFGYASPQQMLAELARDASSLYVDREQVSQLHEVLRSGGRLERARARVRRRDGSVIWISENARAIFDENGQALFFEGSVVDITAQVEAEEALKQSQALYQVLVENSRDGVFLIQRGKVVFANEAMAGILGYPVSELTGMEYMNLVDPEDLAAQAERRARREAGSRELQVYEVHLLRKDGQRILCEVRADAVEYRGDIASTGTLRDVTEERRRQRAVAEAERRYRELFETSPAGLFRSALDGRIMEVNQVLARLLGHESPDHLKSAVRNMTGLYADPAERPRLVERALREGGFSNHETRARMHDGREKWVSASVRLIRDEAGQPLHFTGSILDVDERHAIQQALQRSETRYRTLVEHSQVGVYVMRGERYTYVNQAFARMIGRSEHEIEGQDFRAIMAPESVPVSEERDRRRAAGEPVPGDFETCLLHKDGRRVYVRVSIGPVLLDGVEHLTGTVLDITRQREAEDRLRFHATHDPLTGLPNRMLFNQRLAEAMSATVGQGDGGYAVLFLDLDGFKWVNDSLGHGAGDRLLVQIARRLEDNLLRHALIARYGGDEFTLLPDGPCSLDRAVEIARTVLRVFEQPFEIAGQQVFSAASVGIVLGRREYESPDQVLRDADTAMYRAKAAGKSGFVVFDEAMHQEALSRLQLETDFRLALERGEFRIHYQPIVDLGSGRLVGAEALVRWCHPLRGLLVPADFLAVAEETGLIVEMDAWVLKEACRQLAVWRNRFPDWPELTVNVNVDEKQMVSAGIVEEVFSLLQRHGLPPASLRLEVTETAFRTGRAQAEQRLLALKALGVGLVVDDFGTGYSSLESFAASPFDALKMDQVFIRDIASNPRHRAIVRTIAGFARELGLAMTAEGIETGEQRVIAAELGCQYGQGYLFARPLPAQEFEQLLLGDARILG
ncbi:PAS domain S-box protein [Arenimonas fontis]|uniref:PAS domain S-box protein n=1 Tax=Arenimonas fontis TaxID=2608255 RepID=A0A5B2ZG05_9GAMM|nr:PAS domain S-box protein [Arenimonas fontis]KAA2285991.1 PAS domain S-box protein [Arenimonas fontis]